MGKLFENQKAYQSPSGMSTKELREALQDPTLQDPAIRKEEGPWLAQVQEELELRASCDTCFGQKEVLYLIPRPGGPPGNQMVPCPKCVAS